MQKADECAYTYVGYIVKLKGTQKYGMVSLQFTYKSSNHFHYLILLDRFSKREKHFYYKILSIADFELVKPLDTQYTSKLEPLAALH